MKRARWFWILACYGCATAWGCTGAQSQDDGTEDAVSACDGRCSTNEGGATPDDGAAESGEADAEPPANCALSESGECTPGGGATDVSGRCLGWTASSYDPERGCVLADGIVISCCVRGDLSCGEAGVITCLQRVLPDGGTQLLWAAGRPETLLDGFSDCSQSDAGQAVESASRCDG